MLVILSGVSGAGKDTIKKELIKRMENVISLPSFTSRGPRPGEEEGVQYHFITKDEFKQKIKNGEFYEYDLHHENDYLLDYYTINNDFNKMKSVLDTKYFAYPYGHVSDNLINSLKDNNYKLAFTFGPGKEHSKVLKSDDKYHLPRLNISNDMPFWKYKIRLIMPY